MNKFLLISLFCLGCIYRLWLIHLVPQAMIYDQVQYHDYAVNMLKYGLYADSFRIYGYPFIVALIYKFTGIISSVSTLPWQLIQIFIDTSTALLIYLCTKKIFHQSHVANTAYILYLFNPFTAPFAGVLLPEVLTIFLVALFFTLLSFFLRKINIWKIMIFGVLLGFLSQVRPFYFYYSIIAVFIFGIICVRKLVSRKSKIFGLILLLVFYSFPFIYNIAGNLKYFGEFALMDVDNLFVENFYISLFMESSPDVKPSITDYPAEVQWAFHAYSYTKNPMDKVERDTRKNIFIKAAIKEISTNPYKFISWRVKKLWYGWEKHTLFPYFNPDNNFLLGTVYWSNFTLLFLALIGLLSYGKKVIREHNNLTGHLFLIFSILLFLSTTAVSVATSSQERYSLGAYPILFIFCAYGIWQIVEKVKRSR